MGFYIRKSIRVGLLRFNLSKSGIGVSAGIPGFRVGMGPRGNYVHMGRGGVYYRATLPSVRRTQNHAGEPERPQFLTSTDPTVGPIEPIDSGSVLMMSDDSAEGLLSELNEKQQRWRFTPACAIFGALLIVAGWNAMLPAAQAASLGALAIGLMLAHQWDVLRKTTVIMYDLDDDRAAEYQHLVKAVQCLAEAQRLWHIDARAVVLDRKYHAGASSELSRRRTSILNNLPPYVRSNIETPALAVGLQTLYFFPDRLLAYASGSVGAVPYSSLKIERTTARFIEGDGVPRDSQVVGRTWRYVNKNGGPDRRFNNNRELPVCEYEAIHFTSSSGLNELLYASRLGAGAPLASYLASPYTGWRIPEGSPQSLHRR